jgi:hypothetical protein
MRCRVPTRQAVLAWLALGVLALAAEVVGTGLIQRLDVGRHVATPGYAHADFYPPLLAAVKVGIALLAARLAWRFVRARAVERTGLRLLGALGHNGQQRVRPRLRVTLSPRLWAVSFVLTSAIYLLQADLEAGLGEGRWPVLAPLLHTSALPVFAVLSVVVAVLWGIVAGWLREYESHAHATLERGRLLVAGLRAVVVPRPAADLRTPLVRMLAGSLHQRPPPAAAA